MLAGAVAIFFAFVGHGVFDTIYQESVRDYQSQIQDR